MTGMQPSCESLTKSPKYSTCSTDMSLKLENDKTDSLCEHFPSCMVTSKIKSNRHLVTKPVSAPAFPHLEFINTVTPSRKSDSIHGDCVLIT